MVINFATIDWHNKLVAAGIDSNHLTKEAGPCPLCYADDGRRTRHFRFDNKGGLGTWFCQSCGAGNGFTLIERFTGQSRVEILKFLSSGSSLLNSDVPIKRFSFEATDFSPEQVEINLAKLIEVANGTVDLELNDPVSKYLMNRVPGCDLQKLSPNIRFHPNLPLYEPNKNPSKGKKKFRRTLHPGMVARVIDSSSKPISLHRTYLTPIGTKASVEEPKKQMKGVRKLDGAAIRVVEVPESRTLGIAEGIETAFAVATAYKYRINMWSLLNCVNLELADIPVGLFDKIIIFADHDRINEKTGFRPGEHHATLLKQRLELLGYEVVLKLPEKEGTDFADLWKEIYERVKFEREMLPKKELVNAPTSILRRATQYHHSVAGIHSPA